MKLHSRKMGEDPAAVHVSQRLARIGSRGMAILCKPSLFLAASGCSAQSMDDFSRSRDPDVMAVATAEDLADRDESSLLVPSDPSSAVSAFDPAQDACAEIVATSFRPQVVLEFVLDTSRSMATPLVPSSETRLAATATAINAVLETVAPDVQVGMMRYPGGRFASSECLSGALIAAAVELGPLGSVHRDTLRLELAKVDPEGETPTVEGLLLGLRYLELLSADSQRFMVLITDGAPSEPAVECPTEGTVEQQLTQAVSLARQQSIRTFVIGSPGSEHARETLSQLALLGGTPRAGCGVDGLPDCHYDVTDSSSFLVGIQAALTEITGAITACRYALPTAPPGQVLERDFVNLRYFTNQGSIEHPVLRDDSADCLEGWHYSGDQIVLCPNTCEAVQSDPENEVQVLLGCESRVVLK